MSNEQKLNESQTLEIINRAYNNMAHSISFRGKTVTFKTNNRVCTIAPAGGLWQRFLEFWGADRFVKVTLTTRNAEVEGKPSLKKESSFKFENKKDFLKKLNAMAHKMADEAHMVNDNKENAKTKQKYEETHKMDNANANANAETDAATETHGVNSATNATPKKIQSEADKWKNPAAIINGLGLDFNTIPEDVKAAIPSNINFTEIEETLCRSKDFPDLNPTHTGHHLSDLQKCKEKSFGDTQCLSEGDNPAYFHFDLRTSKAASLYEKHKIESKPGESNDYYGHETFKEYRYVALGVKKGLGPNQCDFSQITSHFSVSCSPVEYKAGEPYFKALKAEEIPLVIDLRDLTKSNDANLEHPYMDSNTKKPLSFLDHKEPVKIDGNQYRLSTEVTYDGYNFTHLRISDLKDNDAFANQKTVDVMKMIDKLLSEKGLDPRTTRIAFHCNGGLGRAPMLLTLRTLWNAKQSAMIAGIETVYDANLQTETDIDGKLNMAAVLKNILCLGTSKRSTFMQSKAQFNSVREFAKSLGEQN
ncbi:MAG: hypothetical protein LBI56_03135 [Puniceicoccales bacterium]|jgi:protein-tyrosine phosphatase|nr:hypothetical protein [Puniceicoccales bacterium]